MHDILRSLLPQSSPKINEANRTYILERERQYRPSKWSPGAARGHRPYSNQMGFKLLSRGIGVSERERKRLRAAQHLYFTSEV